MKKMEKFRIGTRPFFWPMHKQKIFKFLKKKNNSNKFLNSEYVSKYGFYLPSSLTLKNSEIDYICKKVNYVLQ
jgi:perosamine synthetase